MDEDQSITDLTPKQIAEWFLESTLLSVSMLQTELGQHGVGLHFTMGMVEESEE
mgnify:CR=1 FL=1